MLGKNIKKLFEGGPTGFIGFIAGLLILLLCLSWFMDSGNPVRILSHSEFAQAVEDNQIVNIKVSGDEVYGKLVNDDRFESTVHFTDKLWDKLKEKNISVVINTAKQTSDIWIILGSILFVAILIGIWMALRKSKGNGSSSSLFSFGKSRFKKILPGQATTRFSDVAGAKNAKDALSDVVDFLKDPDRFKRMGARIPKGILLSGEPGNGKTLLARAVAGEAGCTFLSISGADFIEVFVGVGAARIRDLFSQARKSSPCILFIDEIDAIGRARGSGMGGGHDEREQTLNQLLTEMDGFDQYELPLVVMAATNIPEVLDKALLRPGRFDRIVNVPYPDYQARLQLLKIHTAKTPLAENLDLEEIASSSQGLSGADMENLVNIAALRASQARRSNIEQQDFEAAYRDILNNRRDAQTSKDSAKEFLPQQVKTRFSDVAGCENAKEDMKEVVDCLKNPEKYAAMGARVPHGVLMYGAPGNGKTLLARAIAGEAGVPFFYASGSQFVQKYVGVGAERIRELFTQARKNAPSLIFLDEIDAIGKRRNSDSGGDAEYNQTINQLLTEMDGFNKGDLPVIVIGATNMIDSIDSALKRPGRFDRHVHIDYPNLKARIKILNVHARGKKFSPEVNLDIVAKATSGFSGASLENLLNEAAILAVSREKEAITPKEIEEARDRIIMGKANFDLIQQPDKLKKTAYHEAGHALAFIAQPDFPYRLHKVTILARGGSLGSAHYMPVDDQGGYSKPELEARIVSLLAGRVAEEIAFNVVHTGAINDFERASEIARMMVCGFGMGEKTGIVSFTQVRTISGETGREIDLDVRSILTDCKNKTYQLLSERRAALDAIANALLEKETLDANEVYTLAGIPFPADYNDKIDMDKM